MQRIAFINKKFVSFNKSFIHIEDRGFQFSDSVYEVIMIINSKLIDFDFHIKRLKFSLSELSINYQINKKYLNKIFSKLIKKNLINDGIIYLQITRGTQSREHSYKKNIKPTVVAYTQKKKFNFPLKKYKAYKAITYPDLRWKRRDIKTTSLLPNILASSYANKKNAYEAIFIQNNKVTEASHSNVWIVKRNIIYTHPSNSNILKGITRTVIKKIILSENLLLREKYFSLKQLYNADEIFITSSGSLITPINKIDNITINNGKIGVTTRLLAELLYKFYKKQI